MQKIWIGSKTMLSKDEMISHAEAWIAAWNRRDIDAVIAEFAPDAVFRSPKAIQFAGESILHGRDAIASYWSSALARVNQLQFTLISVICDPVDQSMVVLYSAEIEGVSRRACEIFWFRDGAKLSGEALYGDFGA
jgi:steroid delta-isomerase